jgi:hypothetical protein
MKNLKTILLVIVTLLILGFLFSRINFTEIRGAFSKSNKAFLLFIHLLPFFITGLLALRWMAVLKLFGHKSSFKKTIHVYLASVPVSRIAPANFGDYIKAYYMRDDIAPSKSAGGVLLEQFLDIFALLVLVIFGSLFSKNYFFFLISLTVLLLMAVFLFLLLKMEVRFLKKWQDKIDNFFSAFKKFFRDKNAFCILAFTFLAWLVMLIYVKGLFFAFGFNIPFGVILAFQPIVTLISLIPVTFSGIGAREAVMIYFYSAFAPASSILAVALIYSFFAAILFPAICLPFAYKMFRKSKGTKSL